MHLSIARPGVPPPPPPPPLRPRGIWPPRFTRGREDGEFDHEMGSGGGTHWPSSVCTLICVCSPRWFNKPSRTNIPDVPCPGVGLFDHFLCPKGGVFGWIWPPPPPGQIPTISRGGGGVPWGMQLIGALHLKSSRPAVQEQKILKTFRAVSSSSGLGQTVEELVSWNVFESLSSLHRWRRTCFLFWADRQTQTQLDSASFLDFILICITHHLSAAKVTWCTGPSERHRQLQVHIPDLAPGRSWSPRWHTAITSDKTVIMMIQHIVYNVDKTHEMPYTSSKHIDQHAGTHICTHIRTHACIHTDSHAHRQPYTHTRVHARTHTNTHKRMHAGIHTPLTLLAQSGHKRHAKRPCLVEIAGARSVDRPWLSWSCISPVPLAVHRHCPLSALLLTTCLSTEHDLLDQGCWVMTFSSPHCDQFAVVGSPPAY